MVSFRSNLPGRWLLLAAGLLLLSGCKGIKPEATAPLWRSVDSSFFQTFLYDSFVQHIDAQGNTWQVVNNIADGSVLRIVDAGGVEQSRLALPAEARAMQLIGDDAIIMSSDCRLYRMDRHGMLVWQNDALLGETVCDLSAGNGNVVAFVRRSSGGYFLQPVSAAGEFSPPVPLDAAVGALGDPVLSVSAGGMVVTGSRGVMGLADDGSVLWHYTPPLAASDSLTCSAADTHGLVCAYPSPAWYKNSLMEWISMDGSVLRSESIPLSDIDSIQSTGDGRVLFSTVQFPVPATLPLIVMLYGADYLNYSTTRLHVIDEAGTLATPVVLPPREYVVVPQMSMSHILPLGYDWVLTREPAEQLVQARIVADQILVAGYVDQSEGELFLRYRRNLAAAYALTH